MIFGFCLAALPCFGFESKAQKISPKLSGNLPHRYDVKLAVDMDQDVTKPEEAHVHYSLMVSTGADLKIADVREDQSADISVTLIDPRVRFSLRNSVSDNDLLNLEYDSTSENELPLPPFQYVAPVAKSLNGAELTIVVDRHGRVSEIKNLKSLRRRIDKELGSTLPEDLKEQLCSSMESEMALAAAKYFTCYLPDHKVKVGDTWVGDKTLFGLGDKKVWNFSIQGKDRLRVEKAYTVTKAQMETLVGRGIFKDAEAEVQETVDLEKESFAILSNQINVSTKAHQKMPLPDGRDLDATYHLKASLSLSRQKD